MTAPQRGPAEIARGLAAALKPALAPGASPLDRMAARDVAQLLGLNGLDAVLAEFDRHAGAAWPREISHVAARLERLAGSAETTGEVSAFWSSDRELEALARQLQGLDYRDGAPDRGAVQTLAVADVLEGLPLESDEEVGAARMSAPVAASLRAALDWMGADLAPRLVASVHDTALTLTTEVTHEGGIAPAGAILGAIEGSLGRELDGRWTLRVPLHVGRCSYLLVRQGRIALALPWHSIARLRMLPQHEITSLAEPRLAPLGTLDPTQGERPAALIAVGLTRAWLLADRIVWRIAAVPEDADVPGPFPDAHQFVSIDNGERYWTVDGTWLLRGIPARDAPPPSSRARGSMGSPEIVAPVAPVQRRIVAPPAAPAAVEAVQDTVVAKPAPAVALAPAGATGRTESAMFAAHITVLRPEQVAPRGEPVLAPEPAVRPPATLESAHVTPLEPPPVPTGLPAAPVAPDVSAAPARSAGAARPSEIAARTPARRALVADDSLVARIFLSRLLERRGFVVEAVADATSMWAELRRGPWSIVLADLSMPDASGQAHIAQLLDFRASCREPFTVVVLTRDVEDESAARAAGARLCLRKPFEADAVDQMLAQRLESREDRS